MIVEANAINASVGQQRSQQSAISPYYMTQQQQQASIGQQSHNRDFGYGTTPAMHISLCGIGDLSQYEWKVKRRPDGTRYITRRPLRSQLLKGISYQNRRLINWRYKELHDLT